MQSVNATYLHILFTCISLDCSVALYQATTVGQASNEQDSKQAPPQFALLVGVDYYFNSAFDTLRAPGTDVALMKTLLVDRYNFHGDSEHMLVLTGKQATRKAIEDSFRTQLIANAQKFPNATLLFYYSGHGSLTPDNLHETIVPSDGRTGDVLDITDDELSDLLDEILKYTTKEARIIFIFDSCSSGTIIKGLDESLRAKGIPPDPRPRPKLRAGRPQKVVGRDVRTGMLPRSDSFVALDASYAYESAYELCLPDPTQRGGNSGRKRQKVGVQAECQSGYRPSGVFTYFLSQILDNSPNITYRHLVEQVLNAVNDKCPKQHPNVEGDIDRPIFGIYADREDPFIRISGAMTGRSFRVNAGVIQGLQEGTFLAVYRPEAVRLTGEANKICNARVIKTENFTAIAEISGGLDVSVPADSKIAIVTPYFGGRPLRVWLNANQPGTILTADDKQFINETARILKSNQLIEVVSGVPSASGEKSGWDVGLQRSQFTNGHPCGGNCPPDATPSFYWVTADQNDPLYAFTVRTTDVEGPGKIAEMLTSRIRQQNVRAIMNARSPFKDQVKLGVVKAKVDEDADGHPHEDKEARQEIPLNEVISLHGGQYVILKVENDSEEDLNAVLIDIGTSGRISLMTPRGGPIRVPAHESFTTQVFKLAGPSGLETFKAIAYTDSVEGRYAPDFSFLERKGSISFAPKDISSPLGWLFSQAVGGVTKGGSELDLDKWTVARLDVYITND